MSGGIKPVYAGDKETLLTHIQQLEPPKELPAPQMMDRLTRGDELLELMIPILEQIRDRDVSGTGATGAMETSEPEPNYYEVWFLFNAAGDLLFVRKSAGRTEIVEREIDDASVSDRVIDATKTIKYKKWQEILELDI